MKIIVSACLLGDKVKYNGESNKNQELIDFLKDYDVIKVCPEVMGGLPIPRDASEIQNDFVYNKKNINVTEYFNKGALKTLDIVKNENIKVAILKEKSPSCGSNYIYDGTFSNKLISGMGVTSRLLKENNVIILNENNYKEYFEKEK